MQNVTRQTAGFKEASITNKVVKATQREGNRKEKMRARPKVQLVQPSKTSLIEAKQLEKEK